MFPNFVTTNRYLNLNTYVVDFKKTHICAEKNPSNKKSQISL